MSTLLVMAGGTGGHVYPALAVAEYLRQRGVSVIWLGTRNGFEARAVPEAGFDIEWVNVSGLRGKGLARWLLLPFVMAKAMAQTSRVISRRRPDALLGMGGFVSGPGGLMAWLRRKPLVIHEQNAVCGMTNRLLARFADRVLTGFSRSGLPASKVEWIGNPVRQDIVALPEPEARRRRRTQAGDDRINVLIVGGSQGADTLNRQLPEALAASNPRSDQPVSASLSIWHQSGRGKLPTVQAAYAACSIEAKTTEFIDDMAAAYAWADLVVCRAGAMTVSEVSAAGIAAIFVPYPYAVDDHQAVNAAWLVDQGGARLVREGDGFVQDMIAALSDLIADSSRLLTMAECSRAQSKPKATESVAMRCMEVMHA